MAQPNFHNIRGDNRETKHQKKREGLSVGFNWAIAVIQFPSQLALLEQHSEDPGKSWLGAGRSR